MKFYKQLIFILIIFFQTGTLFSKNNLFSVNNIEFEKKGNISNDAIADIAIKKGFNQLISRILLKEDFDKLSNLDFPSIKNLVTFYQIKELIREKKKVFVNFSVTFDKDKLHKLFFKRGISYSEISDKELFTLPILIKNDEIFIFNNNFFYKNWNLSNGDELIEFILPIENIEIIQNINKYKNNLIDLNVLDLFKEYTDKNLALIFIEVNKNNEIKVYIKSNIQGKKISKSLNYKDKNLINDQLNEKIINNIKKELINLVKSKNLIDIRTPSFLIAKLDLGKKSNLVELNSRISKIDSIESVSVQNFNKDQMNLRIKYLGKLEKIINQLKKESIVLDLINDQWIIKAL